MSRGGHRTRRYWVLGTGNQLAVKPMKPIRPTKRTIGFRCQCSVKTRCGIWDFLKQITHRGTEPIKPMKPLLSKNGFLGMGISFQVRLTEAGRHTTRRPCLLPPPSLRQMELRTGTDRDWCSDNLTLWGCCQICSNLVPFYDRRTNGGRLEKRSP